ncbi:hypothetical protein Tco_0274768, partial [Tanacetum coccineum]
IVDGITYVGDEFCTSLKDVEDEAAKVAFLSLSAKGSQEVWAHDKNTKSTQVSQKSTQMTVCTRIVYKSGLQKRDFPLPVYTTNVSGKAHVPSFNSKVDIADICYGSG